MRWGLTILPQNAGITGPHVPIEQFSVQDFTQVLGVNVVGAFLCTREAVKVFKSQSPPGGELAATSSLDLPSQLSTYTAPLLQ